MKALSKEELEHIGRKIECHFDDVLSRYDTNKYPEKEYEGFKKAFSVKNKNNTEIKNAMKWKWGHWRKPNYPNHHKALISEIQTKWKDYCKKKECTPKETFDYWKEALEKSHRYISVAFITHLIHHNDVPIIDQHNYRAMNQYMASARSDWVAKKKPSKWEDIMDIKEFMQQLGAHINRDEKELDRYFMMFGRYCAKR